MRVGMERKRRNDLSYSQLVLSETLWGNEALSGPEFKKESSKSYKA